MMKPIVEEKPVSFKELEQKISRYVCELGCEITKTLLGNGEAAYIYLLDEAMQMDKIGLISAKQMQETVETLSAAKAPKKDGKGDSYVDVASAHMPLLEAMQTASRKAFKKAFC